MYKNKKIVIVCFLLPIFLLFIVNVVYPIIASTVYSFFSWDGISEMKYVGFKNYMKLFGSPVFYKACINSLYLVIGSGLVQVLIGLILAVLLNSRIRGFKLFRTVYFFPVMISSVSIALMFSLIYAPQFGLLNSILKGIGLENLARPWLGDSKVVIFAAIFPQIWQYIGLMFVIQLAALQNIPSEIMEYTSLDGATGLKKLFYINIPLIWEVIQICVVLGVTGSLREFEHIWVLTEGGPMHASEILGTHMYLSIFKGMQFGYGSSVAFIIFIIGLLFTVIFKKYFSGETIQY